jgi:FMN phosphatase YigB (HAD superfamily)
VVAPKALLFDFGGTLDLPGSHWLDRFLENYRRAGIEITREQLDPAFAHGTDAGYRAGDAMRERGLGETVGFLIDAQFDHLLSNAPDAIRVQLDREHDSAAALKARIAAGFVEDSKRGLASSRELLSILARNFRLGVISNFYGNLDRILAQARIADLFETVIDSSRVGLFKPDPRIYQAALQAFALPAGQVAVIGDSLGKDCVPAHALGMRTVWLAPASRNGRVEANASAADYTIRELRELTELRW